MWCLNSDAQKYQKAEIARVYIIYKISTILPRKNLGRIVTKNKEIVLKKAYSVTASIFFIIENIKTAEMTQRTANTAHTHQSGNEPHR